MDLDNFKNILLEQKANLLEKLQRQNSNINILNASNLKESSDIVSASIQGQFDSLLLQKYEKELQEVNIALEKIKNKTFGICEMCDDMINIERLKAKPHAKLCIECREIYETKQEVLKIKNKELK